MILSTTASSSLPSLPKKQDMWRSKLGTNYPKDFMDKNETRLFKEVQSVKDRPENRICADCGTRGTNWASVNLGVFLCMACGSHHRSLGTHISLPKGCSGTYLWGPDEIERMTAIGNARAKELYGDTLPSGLTNDDQIRWKEYLMDKYVHKKFAPASSSSSSASTGSMVPPAKPTTGSLFQHRASPKIAEATKHTNKKFLPDMDLIRFDDDLVHNSPSSPQHSSFPINNMNNNSHYKSQTIGQPSSSSPPGKGKDFFAEFGL
jgi:hypothetical protein